MQRRLPPPVIALLTALGMYLIARVFPPAQAMPLIQHVLAMAIAACALLIDIAALWSFQRHKTTVNPLRPEKARLIISNGIYSFSRNPMYLGMLLWLFAFGCWLGSTWSFPLIMLFYWMIECFQIPAEEKALREKFGAEYLQYCLKVNRWLGRV
ncbi:MAG: isoprenylcysteine carboxylmethyltransferase family protein [Oceanospirillaceae bacterium]|nr:isoprenylcysteine carboxylmethyltransferase family protein [Oceanospirillaceae bacterium]MCP5350288.1 isoprenylcysteine carboxylmethyltransferase family protein [Oceanospirillaceae bacterium]